MSQIDWSKAPKDATHYLADGSDVIWYQVGKSIYRWAGHGWVYGRDLPKLLKIIPEVAGPDWSKGPADATHWGPRNDSGGKFGIGFGEAFYKIDRDYKGFVANKTTCWDWCPLDGPVVEQRRVTLIERPAPESTCEPAAVDWSKGPEGAEAFADGFWFKPNHRWIDGAWEHQHPEFGDHAHDYPDAQYRPADSWNGEGLPPVGVVCEVKGCMSHYLQWNKVTVFAVRGKTVFFDMEDGRWGQTDSHEFRAIRTPEQIAAESRDKAVSAMWTVLNARLPESYRTFDGEALRSALGILHVQGYRKAPGYAELLEFAEWVIAVAEKESLLVVKARKAIGKVVAGVRGAQ